MPTPSQRPFLIPILARVGLRLAGIFKDSSFILNVPITMKFSPIPNIEGYREQRYASFEREVHKALDFAPAQSERLLDDYLMVSFEQSGESVIALPYSSEEGAYNGSMCAHSDISLYAWNEVVGFTGETLGAIGNRLLSRAMLFGFGSRELTTTMKKLVYVMNMVDHNFGGTVDRINECFDADDGESRIIGALRGMIRRFNGIIEVDIKQFTGGDRLRLGAIEKGSLRVPVD